MSTHPRFADGHLPREAQTVLTGLALCLLSALAIALQFTPTLSSLLDPSPIQSPYPVSQGLRRLPMSVFFLFAGLACVASHVIYRAIWSRLTACFLTAAFVLFAMIIPDLVTIDDDFAYICDNAEALRKPISCSDPSGTAITIYSFTSLIWMVNIAIPLAALMTFVYGWLLWATALLRRFRTAHAN